MRTDQWKRAPLHHVLYEARRRCVPRLVIKYSLVTWLLFLFARFALNSGLIAQRQLDSVFWIGLVGFPTVLLAAWYRDVTLGLLSSANCIDEECSTDLDMNNSTAASIIVGAAMLTALLPLAS